jgi:putative transposase
VANRAVYAAIGVTVDGRKDVLGCGPASAVRARSRMSVLVDLKNRGVTDVFFVICDGLKGLPAVVEGVWPLTTVQTCIIHLIRNTFRLTSRANSDAIKRDIKQIYTAPNGPSEVKRGWGARGGEGDGAFWTGNVDVAGALFEPFEVLTLEVR